ncbi:MAG: RagB/SusD family nutrient uptake outer membrane protein [Capnocytophaga sp.]|nr:RagB/SusD family nutrient uptake outer membrane protein [Capnocytophaga sp.]
MKKNIIKISLLSAFLGIVGCQDAIDITQDGEITTDVFFSSVDNLQNFLVGDVYYNAQNANAIYLTSVLTDEVKPGAGSGGQQFQLHRFFLDPSTSLPANIWANNYRAINRATRLIEGAKKVTPTNDTERATYNDILAQARTIRALSYLFLETYFSEDMTDDNALGVVILNEVPNIDTKLPRSTNKEVFEAMEEDLVFAEANLKNTNSRYYASKNLVYAIRARLNLYRGKYSEAKTYAQKVIDESGLTLTTALPIPSGTVGSSTWNTDFYKDASTSPYRQIWSDNSQGEVVFAFARPQSGGTYTSIATYYNTNRSSIDGTPMWAMGRNLFNILNETQGDIRRYAYIDPTSTIDANYLTSQSPLTTDQLIVDKYPGKGSSTSRNDEKIFRLSEMYFILAECAVNDNDLASAKNYIQQVREARNYLGLATTPTYATATEAYADILKERRVELAFEGHRYIDLKRLADKAGVTMDRNQTDDVVPVTIIQNGDYRYTLPIPLSEIAGNSALATQQNRGYR